MFQDASPAETSTEAEDENIVWRVNVDRFHQYLRDQAIVAAIGRKIDKVHVSKHCDQMMLLLVKYILWLNAMTV